MVSNTITNQFRLRSKQLPNKKPVKKNMGGANCKLTNNTGKKVVVMTFNNADRTFTSYIGLYTIEPGKEAEIAASADAWGLNVAIGYDMVGTKMLWRRWYVKNGGHMYLNVKDGSHMLTSGDGEHKGTGHTSMDADTASTIAQWMGTAVAVAGAAAGAL